MFTNPFQKKLFTNPNQKQEKTKNDYQTEFDTLRDKEMLFKLEINQKNVEQRFYTYAVKKMSDDNEIIDEFKKKYHIECHVAPHNCEEDDDVDFMGIITPQTGDNMKVVKYSLYLL